MAPSLADDIQDKKLWLQELIVSTLAIIGADKAKLDTKRPVTHRLKPTQRATLGVRTRRISF